ncbi:hypothetical protein LCGC14_2825480, partial [marine sediment metagenome]
MAISLSASVKETLLADIFTQIDALTGLLTENNQLLTVCELRADINNGAGGTEDYIMRSTLEAPTETELDSMLSEFVDGLGAAVGDSTFSNVSNVYAEITLKSVVTDPEIVPPPPAPWLGTWAHRTMFVVDADKVDTTVSGQPFNVFLGDSVGISSSPPVVNDNTHIFDRLGSNANRLKIAITNGGGINQLRVDIERWDHAGEVAVLHLGNPDYDELSSIN